MSQQQGGGGGRDENRLNQLQQRLDSLNRQCYQLQQQLDYYKQKVGLERARAERLTKLLYPPLSLPSPPPNGPS